GVQVDVRRHRLALRVHLEDRLTAAQVGRLDGDLAVEATGAQQRGVEDVGPVGGRDHDDVLVAVEAVHLDEQLVEGLLPLVVTAAQTGAAVRSEEHTSELQSREKLVCRLLLEKKKK